MLLCTSLASRHSLCTRLECCTRGSVLQQFVVVLVINVTCHVVVHLFVVIGVILGCARLMMSSEVEVSRTEVPLELLYAQMSQIGMAKEIFLRIV